MKKLLILSILCVGLLSSCTESISRIPPESINQSDWLILQNVDSTQYYNAIVVDDHVIVFKDLKDVDNIMIIKNTDSFAITVISVLIFAIFMLALILIIQIS